MNKKNIIKLVKKYKTDDSCLEFFYLGYSKNEKFSKLNISNKLDMAFESLRTYINLSKDITIFRTILKDFDEKYFRVNLITQKTDINVEYIDGKLDNYTENKKVGTANVNISANSSKRIELSSFDIDVRNYPKQELKDLILNVTREIKFLENVEPVNFDNSSKLLCQIYKMFYNKKPNFNMKQTIVEAECMLAILDKFNIKLRSDYNFYFDNSENIPWSFDLEMKMNELRALGTINFVENEINIPDNYEKIIKSLGKIIRIKLKGKESKIEYLKKITRKVFLEDINYYNDVEMREIKPYKEKTKVKSLFTYILNEK